MEPTTAAAAPFPFAAGQDEEVMEDAFSVPAFTPEDEERERQSLTEDERRKIVADLCGLADDMAGLRVSNTASSDGAVDTNPSSPSQKPTLRTPAELERNMNLLNSELDAIPRQEKEAYLLALLQCPDQVFGGWRGEVIVEMQQHHQQGGTGRGKVFDAKTMAKKLVDYWQRRLEAFGEDLAFKPMTLAGAMEEELGSMISFSMHRISPCKDAAGRAVLVITPRRRIRSLYPTHRQKRAFWYVLECLSQDPEARQNGAVMIFDGNGLHPGLFDPKFVRWVVGLFDLFPIEWKATHFSHTNAITSRVFIPSFKYFLKKERRNRILVHSGKTSADTLAQYRLPPECLPRDLNLGGMVDIDIMKWVSDRYAFEGAGMSGSSGGDDPEDDNACSHEPMSKRSKTTVSPLSSPPLASLAVQDSSNGIVNSSSALVEPDISSTIPSIEAVSFNDESAGEASGLSSLPEGAFVMTKDEEKLLAKDTGRKSDKRMDRAIVLCLRGPDADKTNVLITAGFHYDKSGKELETKLLDDEGVSLRQRKNQLCRRLRQIVLVKKQREEEGKKEAANCA